MSIPVYPMGPINGNGPYTKQVFLGNPSYAGKITYTVGQTSNIPPTPIPNLSIDTSGMMTLNIAPSTPYIQNPVYIFAQNPNQILASTATIIQSSFNIAGSNLPVLTSLSGLSSSNILTDTTNTITITQTATGTGALYANIGSIITLPSLSITNVALTSTSVSAANAAQVPTFTVQINKYTSYVNQPVYVFVQNPIQANFYGNQYFTLLNFNLTAGATPVLPTNPGTQNLDTTSAQSVSITQSIPLSATNTLNWSMSTGSTFTTNNSIAIQNGTITISGSGQNGLISIPSNTYNNSTIYVFVQNQAQTNLGNYSYQTLNFPLLVAVSPVLTNPGSQTVNTSSGPYLLNITQTQSNTGPLSWTICTAPSFGLSYYSIAVTGAPSNVTISSAGTITIPKYSNFTINPLYVFVQNPVQQNLVTWTTINFILTATYSFSFTFTNLGATGAVGPTSNTYGSQPPGGVTVSAGIQYWTVPFTGTYTIIATGAGQNSYSTLNSYGITVKANYTFTGGQIIKILVGQSGLISIGSANYGAGGGCGGSYVVDSSNNPIIIAGGGGGNAGGAGASGGSAQFTTTGAGGGSFVGSGGTNGSGGGALDINSAFGEYGGSGGGGFNTGAYSSTGGNGKIPNYAPSGQTGGSSFLNGGTGGTGGTGGGGGSNGFGGFGGGGGTGGASDGRLGVAGGGGGGGGGYSGGGGGSVAYTANGGGGGGSYGTTLYSGTTLQNIALTNIGQGSVTISI